MSLPSHGRSQANIICQVENVEKSKAGWRLGWAKFGVGCYFRCVVREAFASGCDGMLQGGEQSRWEGGRAEEVWEVGH